MYKKNNYIYFILPTSDCHFNYPTLSDYLLMQAHNYRKDFPFNLTQSRNRIDPEEIVNRIMGDNTYQFIKKQYR